MFQEKSFGKTTTPQTGRQRPQKNTLRILKEYPFKDITEKIISCKIEVHSSLVPGLLENLYEEAMEHKLKLRGI